MYSSAAEVPIAPMESLTAGVLAGIVCTALLVILAVVALCFMRWVCSEANKFYRFDNQITVDYSMRGVDVVTFSIKNFF